MLHYKLNVVDNGQIFVYHQSVHVIYCALARVSVT